MSTEELALRRLVVIGGVPVDDLTMQEAVTRIEGFIASGKPHQIATVNVDFIIKAQDDPELLHILQKADMLTADGMPVVWGSQLLRVPMKERVAGADLVPRLAERGAEKGWRFYLLGGAPGVADRAAEILKTRHPGLQVVGTGAPPFASIVEMSTDILQEIREAKPDILLVAFGNPKQEKWIHMHLHRLNVPVSIGVGGTLDFIVGEQRRAPAWMQEAGIEWVHRLLQDPQRMWRRYSAGLFRFLSLFSRQWWRHWRDKNGAALKENASASELFVQVKRYEDGAAEATVQVGESITAENCESLCMKSLSVLQSEKQEGYRLKFIFHMHGVQYIDAAGFGALLGIAKQIRAAGGDLYLKGVQPSIQKTFREFNLDILTLGDLSASTAVDGTGHLDGQVNADGWRVFVIPSRLDVDRVEQLRSTAEFDWLNESKLILDLSHCNYMDSAGITWIHSVLQDIHSRGGKVRIRGVKKDLQQYLENSGYIDVFSGRDLASV